MTDESWTTGMHALVVAFPDREMNRGYASDRGALYRHHLNHLTDEAWMHAVSEAIRTERWFPTIAALLDLAGEYRPALLYIGPAKRTEEEAEEARAQARRGLELVKQAVAERVKKLPPAPAPSPLPEANVVVAHDDRLDKLRQQAKVIVDGGEKP
jgi:hypothetical protein